MSYTSEMRAVKGTPRGRAVLLACLALGSTSAFQLSGPQSSLSLPRALRLWAVDADDRAAMREAVDLAGRPKPGATFPNPAVGCVIVAASGGEVGLARTRGEGFHPRAGWPHAEVRTSFD